MSSFSTNFYVFLLLFTVTFGITNGLTYAVALHVSWIYFPNREGLISGIIVGSFGLGGFVYGMISTLVVNPDEVDSREIDEKNEAIEPFDDEIASNVPKMLRTLALCWTGHMVIAMLLIQKAP